MWVHTFSEITDVPISQLWNVLADISRWPEIHTQIESIAVDGTSQRGTQFKLKPKGGPRLSIVVDRFERPNVYADLCSMPLAKMRTTRSLLPKDQMTEIRVTIEIFGLLTPLWSRIVGRRHSQGLAAQTKRFIARAREFGATQ